MPRREQLDQARELGQRFGERILFMYHHMLQSRIDSVAATSPLPAARSRMRC